MHEYDIYDPFLSAMQSTPIITANFLDRCEPGDADVSIEKMSTSKQFNRFQARLMQKGKEKIRAFGTFADENKTCPLKRCEASGLEIAELGKCAPLPEIRNYTLFSQVDVRLDPVCTGWLAGQLSATSEIKGWIKFKDDRPFDVLSILLMADAFPPAMVKNATSWLQEDHSWRKTTRHGHSCALFANRNLGVGCARQRLRAMVCIRMPPVLHRKKSVKFLWGPR